MKGYILIIKNCLNRFSLTRNNSSSLVSHLTGLTFKCACLLLLSLLPQSFLSAQEPIKSEIKTIEIQSDATPATAHKNQTSSPLPSEITTDTGTTLTSELESESKSDSEQVNAVTPEEKSLKPELPENPWLFLHAYHATYNINADGDTLGNATERMSYEDGQWNVEMSTKLKKWFITLRSKEYSNFVIQDKRLTTTEFYSSTIMSLRKDRIMKQVFDWQNKMETGNRDEKNWNLPLDEHVFDRLSHLVQLRADLLVNQTEFDYLISYKGKRIIYSYTLEREEKISTPFGEFNAVKMVRTKGDDSFAVWMSPELNYFPVKIAKYEEDKADVELVLSNLEFLATEKVAAH